eukprot:9055723-Alexandrium_andersonii.AAC.1
MQDSGNEMLSPCHALLDRPPCGSVGESVAFSVRGRNETSTHSLQIQVGLHLRQGLSAGPTLGNQGRYLAPQVRIRAINERPPEVQRVVKSTGTHELSEPAEATDEALRISGDMDGAGPCQGQGETQHFRPGGGHG